MLSKQRLQVSVRIFALIIAAAACITFGTTHVFAAEKTNQANTLKVSPVRTDIEINPGESKVVQVFVTNLTSAPITVRPVENDFIAGDERGTPALILDADQSAPTHSLKKFLKPLTDVTVPANKSQAVDVTITVPKTAQAGGYFGAIRFAPTAPEGGGEVNLSASVASLILLTVSGPVTEKLNLTEFEVKQGEKAGSLFQTPDNLQVSFRFENKGNLQMGPLGQISVQKGGKVVYSKNFNDKTPRDVILPDSARRWDIPLEKIDAFGYYKVTGTFTYGKINQTVQVERTFWVIPIAYMIGGAIALVVLIALIIVIVLALRNYKKRILRNSRGSYRR
ncbi:MAG: DUF916 domain-containing protein [Candidatus Saccharimonas sp.]